MIIKTALSINEIISRLKRIVYLNEEYNQLSYWSIKSGDIEYRGDINENGFVVQRNLKGSRKGSYHLNICGEFCSKNAMSYIKLKPRPNEGHIFILFLVIPTLVYLLVFRYYLYFLFCILVVSCVVVKLFYEYYSFCSLVIESLNGERCDG